MNTPDANNETHILAAASATDIEHVRYLFREYAEALGVSLSFQHFEEELGSLPGDYAPPAGALLLAWRGSALAGCVALRPFRSSIAEMKRLYVRAEFRHYRIGRLLAQSVIARARELNYTEIVLDTLGSMAAARQLYKSLGFVETTAYYPNPLPDVVYMRLKLV